MSLYISGHFSILLTFFSLQIPIPALSLKRRRRSILKPSTCYLKSNKILRRWLLHPTFKSMVSFLAVRPYPETPGDEGSTQIRDLELLQEGPLALSVSRIHTTSLSWSLAGFHFLSKSVSCLIFISQSNRSTFQQPRLRCKGRGSSRIELATHYSTMSCSSTSSSISPHWHNRYPDSSL